MMRLPPLNAIRAFEAAARHQSFSLAADELHVTPSAVSHQIKALEEFLGVKLFLRHTRYIEMTAPAQRYLPSVQRALEELNRSTRQLMGGMSDNIITLSLAPAFASGWLIPRLYDFYERHPDIEIRLSTSLKLIDFDRSDCDLAVRYGEGQWAGLAAHRVLAEELVPLCSPKLLEVDDSPKRPEDLKRQRLLFATPRMGDWENWFSAAGVDCTGLTVGARLESIALVLEAAASGMGYAVANRQLAEQELQSGRLVVPFDIATLSESAYYLIYPSERKDEQKIRLFREWMLGQV